MAAIPKRQIFIFLLFILSIIGLILLYVIEIQWFQNTLNVQKLVLVSIGLGSILGGVGAHYFAKRQKEIVDKMRLYTLGFFFGIILFPLMGSLTNRLLTFERFEEKQVELFEQKGFIADMGLLENDLLKPDGYFTFIIIDGKLFRLKSKKKLYKHAIKGDLVEIKIKKGLWGFKVIQPSFI